MAKPRLRIVTRSDVATGVTFGAFLALVASLGLANPWLKLALGILVVIAGLLVATWSEP